MRAHLHQACLFLLICAALAFSGCRSSPPPQDRFYRLVPEINVQAYNKPSVGTILVTHLNSRGFTGGRRIVFRNKSHQFRVQRYAYDLWSEPPAAMIHNALVKALRMAVIADYVITPTERANADWILSGSLFRAEQLIPEGRVELEIELTLVSAQTRKTRFQRRYLETQDIRDTSMAQVVYSFDQALAHLIENFVKDVGKTLRDCQSRIPECR